MKYLLTLWIIAGLSCCQPAQRPEDIPGPAGCGLKDPRQSAPSALSYAQKKTYKDMRSPFRIEKNVHGGLDWFYQTQRGSVFGEKLSVLVYSFNQNGQLVDQKEDVIKQLGKAE